MPFKIERKNPLDISKRKYVGIQYPFNGDAVFRSNTQTIDAYKSDLTLFLLSNKGETYMIPEKGFSLNKMLFEPSLSSSEISTIKTELLKEITYNFPKLVVDSIDISSDGNDLSLNLIFHIKDSEAQAQISLEIS